jgi:hypothetical protein
LIVGYRDITQRSDALQVFAQTVLKLEEDDAVKLVELVSELAQAMADNEIDRLFNRGDYRG